MAYCDDVQCPSALHNSMRQLLHLPAFARIGLLLRRRKS